MASNKVSRIFFIADVSCLHRLSPDNWGMENAPPSSNCIRKLYSSEQRESDKSAVIPMLPKLSQLRIATAKTEPKVESIPSFLHEVGRLYHHPEQLGSEGDDMTIHLSAEARPDDEVEVGRIWDELPKTAQGQSTAKKLCDGLCQSRFVDWRLIHERVEFFESPVFDLISMNDSAIESFSQCVNTVDQK